jgi:hypothetical protein
MSTSLKKTVVGSLTALAIGISAVAITTPASAAPRFGGHGGFGHGGFRGGGFHGGWRGGGWGPGIGLGVLGLAAGAAIAANGPYGYGYDGYYGGYGYGDGYGGCGAYRPVYDAYGNYMGRRVVNVC